MKTAELITEYGAVIRKNLLFRGLSDEELTSAADFFRVRAGNYVRGDFLKQAGEPMERFGLVLRGSVRVCTDDLDGNRMIMAEVSPGDTFGESLCYLGVADSPVYAYAAEDTAVMWLSAESLREEGDGELRRRMSDAFIKLLAARTLSMNSRIQILSKKTLRMKLNTFFTEYSRRGGGGKTFTVPFDRSDMAAFLGTDRTALSRELSRMKAEGLIDFYRNTFRIL